MKKNRQWLLIPAVLLPYAVLAVLILCLMDTSESGLLYIIDAPNAIPPEQADA